MRTRGLGSMVFARLPNCARAVRSWGRGAPRLGRCQAADTPARWLQFDVGSEVRGRGVFSVTHCQECGRRLTSVFFCLACELSFCSLACLREHVARHAPADAAASSNSEPGPASPATPADPPA